MASDQVVPSTRWTVGLICAGHFMSHFWQITLPAIFTILAVVFHVNFVQLGLLVTVYSIATAICQIPCGYVVDRHGAKLLLVVGILLNGVAFALCAIAPNYVTLLILMLFAGAGQAVFHPADYSILSALYPQERVGKPFAVHTFSGWVGSAAAPLIIAGLASAFDWQVAVAAAGLSGIVIGIIVALFLNAPEVSTPPEPVREQPEASGRSIRQRLGTLSYIFSQTLLLLFAFFVFSSMTTSGIRSFLPAALESLTKLPISTTNAMLTAFLAAVAVCVLAGGVLADRITHHGRLIAACSLLSGGLLVPIAVVRLPEWLIFVVLIGSGALQGLITPSRDKMVRQAGPEGSAGKSFAFVSVGLSVGGIVAPLVLGALLDGGNASLVFWVLALFCLIAAVAAFLPGESQPGQGQSQTPHQEPAGTAPATVRSSANGT